MSGHFVVTATSLGSVTIVFAVALLMKLFPPQWPNTFIGYRTPRSKKSKASWDFAQQASSTCLMLAMPPCVLAIILAHIFINDVALLGYIQMSIVLLGLFISIFLVERALKRRFPNK